ncbi:MAG TPA: hypothetical protein PK685_01995 [archaeon]|nr:hypothetical protein [archaeon]
MKNYLESLKNCVPNNFQIETETPFIFDPILTGNSIQSYSIIGLTEEGCQVRITQTKMYFSKTPEEDYKKVLIYFNSYDESEYNYPSDEEINEKLKKINDSYSFLLGAESTCYFNEEQVAMFFSDFEKTKEGIIEIDTTKDSFLYSNCEGDLFN